MIAKVEAYIEIDTEEVIKGVSERLDTPVEDIVMGDIYDYVNDNISYLKGKAAGIKEVEDGPSICGFERNSYDQIEETLLMMQAKSLWKSFGDIPIDDNDCIIEKWKEFEAGTNRFDIWHWFEDTFHISITNDLM